MKARLIFASTKNKDMLYAVRTPVPDAFFFLELDNRKIVFLDKRELGVFKEHDPNGKFEVLPLEAIITEASKLTDVQPGAARLALTIIRQYVSPNVEIEVPASLPLDVADSLRAQGVKLSVKNSFYPERMRKEAFEVDAIEDALARTKLVYQRIEKVLRDSVIRGNEIIFEDKVLTSEFIKKEADQILLDQDMINIEGIIISSGVQASMPHHMGSGPLLPNQPIICDIFPFNRSTGYFADMTRTYVKGKASDEMKRIYETVKESQEAGIMAIKPGMKGTEVHKVCADVFRAAGYEVGEKGFVHGTGHGLGLDIHESPYLSPAGSAALEEGNVVTVEPGLYYPDRGSVRIEDVVVVTKDGCRNLTNYPKVLEIP